MQTRNARDRSGRIAALLGTALLPFVAGCSVLSRIDYANFFNRKGWQHTDRVIADLAIEPGDRIADLGAGDGYFTFFFAEAVGPQGRVFAVEIDPDRLATLRTEVKRRALRNVEVVEGRLDGVDLPDGSIDLVFFCNAYHHFEGRVAYLHGLRRSLAPGARIAIVDGKSEGAARILIPPDHRLAPERLEGELREAGFRKIASYDYLPLQTFDVFESAPQGVAGR